SGVALRHGGPRDATSVPPSTLTESLISTAFVAPDLAGRSGRPASVPPGTATRILTPCLPGRRVGRADRAPSLPCPRPRVGARRLRPDRPTPARPRPAPSRGHLAPAGLSSQVVPRFSSAHITRTR